MKKTCVCLGAFVVTLLVPAGVLAQSTLYQGARLIAGDLSPVIERSAMLVEGERIMQVGRQGQIKAPANARRVDLSGKTVMPALVATHVHPGFQIGATYVRENLHRRHDHQ